ncbi:MAG: inositol 2-dehydrogenase [Spirochaetales bacterium]|nr:inositol 2-dehydrogenase [Spirochaetales bacterium]
MSEKLTLGIIGAGRIAHVHAKSLFFHIPEAEVKMIADPYLSSQAEEWAAKFGIKSTSKDYKDIINDPEIDAVLVCSSTDTHAQITQEAALAGKHVFCEKPIDHDVEKIRKTLEVVKKAGVQLQIGFNRRFDHNFKALKEAVESKKIGDLHMVKVTSRDPGPPPIEYVKVSGGMFMDMTIHDFDMVRFLTGSEVKNVFASAAVLVDPEIGKAGDVDTAIITMEMENGTIAVIDNSRKAVYGYDQRAEVFGSKGSVETGNDKLNTAVFSSGDGVVAEKPLFFFLERYEQAFADEMKSFVDALLKGEATPVTGMDGLRPVLIAAAAKKSLETGKKEAVEPA